MRAPLFAAFLILTSCGQTVSQKASSLASFPTSADCPDRVDWNNSTPPPLNRALIQFAEDHIGQQVGSGQCTDLVDEGLRSIGAKSLGDLGPTGPDADYVWGTKVKVMTPRYMKAFGLFVGDILQYRDVAQRVTNPDGSWWSTSAPHHSAIIYAISQDGYKVCTYEQNVNGRLTVGSGTLVMKALTSGTLTVYRPTY